MEHSHNPNLCNSDGETLLHFAAMHYHIDGVDLLLSNGAEINRKTNAGLTPLYWACQRDKNERIIRRLLDYGADVNVQSNAGMTAFMICATNIDYLQLLLNKSANLYLKNHEGKTLLDIVTGYPDIPQFDWAKEHVRKIYAKHEYEQMTGKIVDCDNEPEGLVF